VDRKEAYLAFHTANKSSGLHEHLRNKTKFNARIYLALFLVVIAGFMPYLHFEAFLYFDHLQAEGAGEWIKRSGSIVIVLAIAAEFSAIDAKDIAGLGGHTGFGPYGPALIKYESRHTVSLTTIGVIVQVLMGTLITSHGDIIFNAMPIQVWMAPAIAAIAACLAVTFSMHRMRPISYNKLAIDQE